MFCQLKVLSNPHLLSDNKKLLQNFFQKYFRCLDLIRCFSFIILRTILACYVIFLFANVVILSSVFAGLDSSGYYSVLAVLLWHHGVAVITTVQHHSPTPGLSFCTSSNPGHGLLEICGGENLWQWSWLEIRLKAFIWSTIPQIEFTIIIIFHRSNWIKNISLKVTSWNPLPLVM